MKMASNPLVFLLQLPPHQALDGLGWGNAFVENSISRDDDRRVDAALFRNLVEGLRVAHTLRDAIHREHDLLERFAPGQPLANLMVAALLAAAGKDEVAAIFGGFRWSQAPQPEKWR